MKIRNRKLLNSLNTKKRFKDFEYKNYDSTDSDVYEEEDYMKITQVSVNNEQDFLRKRRLERRLKKKHEIQKRIKKEKDDNFRKKASIKYNSQPKNKIRKNSSEEVQNVKGPRTSKDLNDVFMQMIEPKMDRIFGKAQHKVDTGLDSHKHNYKVAETRRVAREKELQRRKQNPLTYPSKGENLRDQRRVVPSVSTQVKMGLLNERRYMGNAELENMIMDNLSKIGLLVNGKQETENPALFREAMRPSLITQHINFQSKKIWQKQKTERKQLKEKLIRDM